MLLAPPARRVKLTLAALKFGGGNVETRRFGVKWVISAGTLSVPCLAQIPKGFWGAPQFDRLIR